jgi:hypothetical protein
VIINTAPVGSNCYLPGGTKTPELKQIQRPYYICVDKIRKKFDGSSPLLPFIIMSVIKYGQ